MADKKAKEEVTQSPKQKVDTSNRDKNKGVGSDSPLKNYEESPYNKKAVDAVIGSLAKQYETPTTKEQQGEPEEEHKPKLHVLAADRLNSLINEANELGITDIVQILNADRTGQFYLVYRE